MLSILLFRISKSAGMYSPVISDIIRRFFNTLVILPPVCIFGFTGNHRLSSRMTCCRTSSLCLQR